MLMNWMPRRGHRVKKRQESTLTPGWDGLPLTEMGRWQEKASCRDWLEEG